MKLLITGGAGFIGSNFVRYWAERRPGDGLVVLDALTYAGEPRQLARARGSGPGQLRPRGHLRPALGRETLRRHGIETIVHFAAESHNSLAVLDPARFFRTNVLGTQALCDAARRVGVERLPPHLDLRGLRRPRPRQRRVLRRGVSLPAAHALQRLQGRRRPRRAVPTGDLRPSVSTITNCCNNYGPYQFPEKVIPLFARGP